MKWYRVNVPFDVQAPSGLTDVQIRNTIADLIHDASIDLPDDWEECNALTSADIASSSEQTDTAKKEK